MEHVPKILIEAGTVCAVPAVPPATAAFTGPWSSPRFASRFASGSKNREEEGGWEVVLLCSGGRFRFWGRWERRIDRARAITKDGRDTVLLDLDCGRWGGRGGRAWPVFCGPMRAERPTSCLSMKNCSVPAFGA